eukprot:CAMPEP_0174831332 /NCGR_PEP_ID=MMETSP1114-20130205/3030_1 /TAXON_ID=312471 /ORGANISM="Neobodo designis, Strain CCAP 1951/1" /LENGTH=1217 /DNA_ID=CAMNT_0016065153 /DNA_START=104 /DNA_END=3757 /DNA_ORIENTATION=-
MHIKNIVISGFRSYREQNFDDAWSPRHNVIVGKNGSGKSNFFAAVQFVLSEKFANLRAEERKQLFHEGAGRSYTVYVEIVFDNSDGRLVIPGRPDEPEVAIRRTLGLKQDEFRVNSRKFSASEVRQLLESAGFSASNPYYIVEQGKIITLANMRGEDRYTLLKEVAGTQVYESRRAESVAILGQTEERMSKVKEAIAQLEGRMKQLEAETSELRNFQQADGKRRALEYAVFDQELSTAKEALERLDAQAGSRLAKAADAESELSTLQQRVEDASAVAARFQSELADLEKQRSELERELERLRGVQQRLELQQADAKDTSTRAAQEAKALAKEEAELTKALDDAKTQLKAKKLEAAKRKTEAAKAADKLATDDATLETLQARRGRKSQFSNKADRDRWLREEIARNERLIADNTAALAKNAKARADLEKAEAEQKAAADEAKKASKAAGTATSKDSSKREQLIKQRDRLGAQRRALWNETKAKEGAYRRSQEACDRARHKYEKAVRHDIRQGLQSLHETLDEINDASLRRAVHGQVIDLMKVDPAAVTAVDVAAGNALFNVVVDSFDVSSRLLQHINSRKKPGRITFFPLDTCTTKPRDLPTTANASPLLSHVNYDKKFGSVFAELFGRTLLVRTLEAGPQAVSDYDCDAITYDGDQFSRKGGITGGFIDIRSKVKAAAEMKDAQLGLREAKASMDANLQAVATLEQEITGVLREIDQVNSQDDAGRAGIDRALHDLRTAEERLARATQAIEQSKAAAEVLERSSAAVAKTVAGLKAELDTPFQSTLSAAEENELVRLQSTVGKERADADALQSSAVQLQTACQMLDDTARHLERRLHQVQDRQQALKSAATPAEAAASGEVATVTADIDDAKKRLDAVEKAVEKAVADRRTHEEALVAARTKLVAFQRSQQESRDTIDRAHNQRALFTQQKEAAQAKIRKLGAINPAAAAPYKAHAPAKLMQLLKQANEELRKYDHVNKKALDQYTQLCDSSKDLLEQRDALLKELASVQSLLEHLDKQKDEAIARTFKQVQHHFEEVFRELVGAEGCAAGLTLIENDADAVAAGGDPFASVKVDVSFGAGTPNAELAQLSGGQKSLVALALIFAIQRCDPAPFYLFDEIDAALDAEYRSNVARMIKEQSKGCQFITATFKTEMLEAADATFGIFFHNRVSQIKPISMAEASALLRQANEERMKHGRDEADDELAASRPAPSRSGAR